MPCALDDPPLAPLFDRLLTLGHRQLLEAGAPEPTAGEAASSETAPEAVTPEADREPLPAAFRTGLREHQRYPERLVNADSDRPLAGRAARG